MPKNKLLLPLIFLPLIVSCGRSSDETSSPISTAPSSESPVSENKDSVSPDSPEQISSSVAQKPTSEEGYHVDTNFLSMEDNWVASGINIGGILIDISVGEVLVTGEAYPATVSYSGATSSSTIQSFYSNDGIIKFEGDFVKGFTLTCLKAGGTNLTVKDNDGIMLFRYAINVRDALSVENITDFITDTVNFFQGGFAYDKYQIAFLDDKTGMFYANEGGAAYPTMNFTYSFHSEEKMYNQEYVYYQLDVLMSSDDAAIKINKIQLSVNGTSLHAYQKSGLICLADAVFE